MPKRQRITVAEHEKVLNELGELRIKHGDMLQEFTDSGGIGGLRARIAELQSQLELYAREKMRLEEGNARLKERSLEDRIRTDRVIEVTNIVAASLQSNMRLTEVIFSRLDSAAMGQSVTFAPQGVDMAGLSQLTSRG